MDLGFVSVPSIVVICYLVGMIVKMSPLDSRFIPCICGLLGGVLGIIAFFFIPEIIAEDAFTSIAIGIVSGLAATGAHQVGVQLTENKSSADTSAKNDTSAKSG